MVMSNDQLIEQYIELNPYHPGRYDARVTGHGVPVWALVTALKAENWNTAQVAEDYDLPEDAVKAAQAYYWKHHQLIDERIAANEAADDRGTPVVFDAT